MGLLISILVIVLLGGLVLSNKIHSTLLQGMVDTNCVLWDYEFETQESCMIELISNSQK
jgi:hypothetical protein